MLSTLGITAGSAAGIIIVDGGNLAEEGSYFVRTFTPSGDGYQYVLTSALTVSGGTLKGVEIIFVGKGGNAGYGNGGGAGAARNLTNQDLTPGSYPIVINTSGTLWNGNLAGAGQDGQPTKGGDGGGWGAGGGGGVGDSDGDGNSYQASGGNGGAYGQNGGNGGDYPAGEGWCPGGTCIGTGGLNGGYPGGTGGYGSGNAPGTGGGGAGWGGRGGHGVNGEVGGGDDGQGYGAGGGNWKGYKGVVIVKYLKTAILG